MGRICLFVSTFYDVYSNENANIVVKSKKIYTFCEIDDGVDALRCSNNHQKLLENEE